MVILVCIKNRVDFESIVVSVSAEVSRKHVMTCIHLAHVLLFLWQFFIIKKKKNLDTRCRSV